MDITRQLKVYTTTDTLEQLRYIIHKNYTDQSKQIDNTISLDICLQYLIIFILTEQVCVLFREMRNTKRSLRTESNLNVTSIRPQTASIL